MQHLHQNDKSGVDRLLYRIFFYDCPPIEYKGHNPISKKAIDFTKTDEYKFRLELHNELRKIRKLALRLGHVSLYKSWAFKPSVMEALIKGKMELSKVSDSDVELSLKQKGVDMKIGLDIASLTLKKLVKQIVLVAGDADFVPAAKLARREGVDVVLDPLGQNISDDLFEHIDGMKTTLPYVIKWHQKKEKNKEIK